MSGVGVPCRVSVSVKLVRVANRMSLARTFSWARLRARGNDRFAMGGDVMVMSRLIISDSRTVVRVRLMIMAVPVVSIWLWPGPRAKARDVVGCANLLAISRTVTVTMN